MGAGIALSIGAEAMELEGFRRPRPLYASRWTVSGENAGRHTAT